MGHALGALSAELVQDPQEPRVGIALMEEHGQTGLHGHVQLEPEGRLLGLPGREIPEKIQAALADGDDPGPASQREEVRPVVRVELAGVVGMDPGGGEQRRVAGREFGGPVARGQGTAGDDHPGDPGLPGPVDDLGPIGVETVVGEVNADVDEPADGRVHPADA